MFARSDEDPFVEFLRQSKALRAAGPDKPARIMRALARSDHAEAEVAYREAFAEIGLPVDE